MKPPRWSPSKTSKPLLAFAEPNHLARFTFWAVDRDRQCEPALNTGEDCSGIAQQPYAFTDVIERFALGG